MSSCLLSGKLYTGFTLFINNMYSTHFFISLFLSLQSIKASFLFELYNSQLICNSPILQKQFHSQKPVMVILYFLTEQCARELYYKCYTAVLHSFTTVRSLCYSSQLLSSYMISFFPFLMKRKWPVKPCVNVSLHGDGPGKVQKLEEEKVYKSEKCSKSKRSFMTLEYKEEFLKW